MVCFSPKETSLSHNICPFFFFFFFQLPLRNEETEADRIWPSLVAPEQTASPPGSMLADPSPLLPPVVVGVTFLMVSL